MKAKDPSQFVESVEKQSKLNKLVYSKSTLPVSHIRQRLEMYKGVDFVVPSFFSCENPTIQNLDTSLLSLLKGVDECGKVNNLEYSEDKVVDCYNDPMELNTETQHELSYYDALSNNAVENSAPVESPSASVETSSVPVESPSDST